MVSRDPYQRGLDLVAIAMKDTVGCKIALLEMTEFMIDIHFGSGLCVTTEGIITFELESKIESIGQKDKAKMFSWLQFGFDHVVTDMSIGEDWVLEIVFDNGLALRTGYQHPAEEAYEQYQISYEKRVFLFMFDTYDYWTLTHAPDTSETQKTLQNHSERDEAFVAATIEAEPLGLDHILDGMKDTVGKTISMIKVEENHTQIEFFSGLSVAYGVTAQYSFRGVSETIPHDRRTKLFERLWLAYSQAVTDFRIMENWQLHIAFENGVTVDIGYQDEAEAHLKQHEIEFGDKKFIFSNGAFEVTDL